LYIYRVVNKDFQFTVSYVNTLKYYCVTYFVEVCCDIFIELVQSVTIY